MSGTMHALGNTRRHASVESFVARDETSPHSRPPLYTRPPDMTPTLTALLILARALGVFQIVTGFALWFGWLPHAVAIHIALGSLLVLVLWMVSLISLFVLSQRAVPLIALFWGGLVLWLGMAQTTLALGSAHWAIRVAHLVVGLAALGLIESLAKATKLHWSARSTGTTLVLLVAATVADAQTPRCAEPLPRPITMIDVPGSPFMALPSDDGCWLFVSMPTPLPGSNRPGIAVMRRGGGGFKLVQTVTVVGGPTGMAMTHDGKTLVVASGPRIAFLSVPRLIDGNPNAVLGYLIEQGTPGRIQVSTTQDDKIAFVADERAEAITVVDLPKALATRFSASSIIGRVPTGRSPIAVTLSPDDAFMYVTSQVAPPALGWPVACKREGIADSTLVNPQGAIHVVDVKRARTDPAHSIVASVAAGCNVVRLELSPSGDRVYATARNSNALMVFDTDKLRSDSGHALIGRVPVGTAPVGIAVIDGGRKIVVANSNRFAGSPNDHQTLTVVDAALVAQGDRAIIGSIPAGAFPRSLRTTHDGNTLIVANFASNQIELVDLTHLPVESAKP